MKSNYTPIHKHVHLHSAPKKQKTTSESVTLFIIGFLLYIFVSLNIVASQQSVAQPILSAIIPYLGFFPYKDIAKEYHLPGFISSLANFDGEHYLLIARSGYNQYEQAFFPLYPILIKLLGVIFFKNYLLSAFLISCISFFIGLFFFKNYIQEVVTDVKKNLPIWRWCQFFLLTFPTSFFFMTIYTESLFFMLCMACLYCLKKKHIWWVVVLAFLAASTRLVGVFLFIPILFSIFGQKKITKENIAGIVSPFLGLAAYCTYLWKTTGDPLFFLHSQSAFGANRSSDLILFPQVIYRYIKIFFNSAFTFQYFISIIEFSIFIFVLIILCAELIQLLKNKKNVHFYDRVSLNLFSFANLLLPTFTGTFSSVPRYVLMSFSMFIFLGEMKNNVLKIALLSLFTVLHIILFGFYIQGYFVS